MMKIDIIIVVSNATDCANLYVGTGQIIANTVEVYNRTIEIPDLKNGWDIRSIDKAKEATDE